MIYSNFQDMKLSLLGYGTMRVPTAPDGSIDEEKLNEIVDYAIENGVNYFDTAWPYHNGEAERAIGRALNRHSRDSFYLATKFPGHQLSSKGYYPAPIFEEQLKKCGVEYFDFYLLHNVYEKSMDVYLDPQWGIIEYFKEQKRLGRIKHLGFSCHSATKGLKEFLDACGEDMEFCQIQLNYLDWTLQDAKGKYELLTQRGIPVWVMEPVRGGKLVDLRPEDAAKLKALRPDESVASWGFRFLQDLPSVCMILSGMSNMDQLKDNLKTFAERRPQSPEEVALLMEIAEGLKKSVPCTACRYCCEGCPKELDIPTLISIYNDLCYSSTINITMRMELMAQEEKPSACIACGKCARTCPQNIDIPGVMKDFAERLKQMPSWTEICRQREASMGTGL